MPVRADYFNAVNAAFTVCIALLAVGFVCWMHWRLRLWVEGRLQHVIDALKEELPPMIVGEHITRREIEEDRKRLDALESRSRNVEKRLDLLMKRF